MLCRRVRQEALCEGLLQYTLPPSPKKGCVSDTQPGTIRQEARREHANRRWALMSSENVCSVDGCHRFPTIKSYCYMHYARLLRDEDGLRRQPKMCSIEGCNNRSSVRGYCNKHYYRLLRNGDTELRVENRQAVTCSIEGCNKPSSVRGYCNTHYSQLSRKGVIEISHSIQPDICRVGGCNRSTYAKGYCNMHYQRQRRNGDFTLRRA